MPRVCQARRPSLVVVNNIGRPESGRALASSLRRRTAISLARAEATLTPVRWARASAVTAPSEASNARSRFARELVVDLVVSWGSPVLCLGTDEPSRELLRRPNTPGGSLDDGW